MASTPLPTLVPPDMEVVLCTAIMRVPETCREGLLDYLRFGLPPGSFLQAVLANDLLEACRRADPINQRALYDYMFVLENYAPAVSFGSRDNVRRWIEAGQQLRREALAEKGAAS